MKNIIFYLINKLLTLKLPDYENDKSFSINNNDGIELINECVNGIVCV